MDEVGGTVKWLAAKANLQSPTDKQILTPFQLLQGRAKHYHISLFYVNNEEYVEAGKSLKSRFEKLWQLLGIKNFMCLFSLLKTKSLKKNILFLTVQTLTKFRQALVMKTFCLKKL